MSDYSEIFGREPEAWREPLGALRLTLAGDPSDVDVERAQAEVEELVKVLNEHPPAAQVTEEPEWTEDRVEEARIYYRYGVNSGTLDALNTPASIASAISREEQRTMGPIGAHKVETRTKITRTSPWLPVEQEDAS